MEKRQKYVCSYDQAGNLVKTIPPTGVDAKHSDAIFLDEVSKARMNVKKGEAEQNNKVVPSHTLVTDYRYNTLNQVAAQQTPDAGQTKFFYDLLGRLAVSQNAQQKLDKKYSYTLYDNLGRISEVGQKPNVTDPDSKNPDLLQKWLEEDENREQITRTVYDLPYQNKQQENILKGFLEQKNLRNRVSYSMVFDKEPKADILGTHHSATYFSYDIHGNVDTLLQDFNEGVMKATGNRFKKIAYDYDLISGKVNAVHYQSGWQDQFHHKYFYDAENRLVDVYTSKDSLSWQKDARYSYYRHGPLAKTILGQNQVQGIDYAYTLQGWLKGVNSTAVDDGKFDMGEDGLNAKSLVARDAFGFGLHYFGGDYKAINNTVLPFAPIPNLVSLYNGNIAAMSVNIPKVGEPLLNSYKYDQLNRLTKMNTYKGLNPQTNNWNAIAIDDYGEEISYDANGNIQVYKRNGSAGKLDMDKMTYQYPKDINGKIVNNRLRYVHDEVNAANYAEDIDSQTPLTLAQVKAEKLPEQQNDNYVYDAIGNLIEDKKEGINKINWNVYGKIESIEKQNSTIRYSYDASGNRIFKELQTLNNKLQTIYSRDASGNVMSTYTVDANINNGNLTQNEVHLYGSSRLGIDEINRDVQKIGKADYLNKLNTFVTGNVRYEMTDHRGNVMAVVSDKKLGVDANADGIIDHYTTDVVSATDYAPFGMSLSGRKFNASGYRYGFNGKENDKDISEGAQDYGMRINEVRLGRFLSVDPITDEYPELTPYQFASNRPIDGIDLDGLEFLSTFRSTQLKHFEGSNVIKQQQAADLYQQKQMQDISARASRKVQATVSQYREPDAATKQQRQNYKEKALDDAGYNADGTKKPLTKLAENKHFTKFAENIAMPMIEYGMGEGVGKIFSKGIGLLKLGSEGSNYLYHYTSQEAAESILKTGLTITEKRPFIYMTNTRNLSSLQAQIELALPANRALPNSILRINTSGVDPALIRRVTGNLPGYGAGGGTEFLFNQNIPADLIKKIK
jgi:RHS repeat-associated protein